MSTTALDAITSDFYTRGLQHSAYAHALQAEMHRMQYELAHRTGAFATDYGSPSPPAPPALRCAYCATYFVPAGRSCGCGANREEAAPPRREVAAQLRQIDLNTRVTARLMNVYNRR